MNKGVTMRKAVRISGSLLCISIISGCGALLATHRAYYDIALEQVERPADASVRYGKQMVTKSEGDTTKYYFEDEMVRIVWLPSPKVITFLLTNKTDHSIKIIWDEAAYVDTEGITHRVMHSGVKYIDRNNSQPPTVVVRGGTISDLILPTDYVYWASGQYGGWWEESPLFPYKSGNPDQLAAEAQQYVGKTIQILLPLQIEDVVNEYLFTFRVRDVQIRPISSKDF